MDGSLRHFPVDALTIAKSEKNTQALSFKVIKTNG